MMFIDTHLHFSNDDNIDLILKKCLTNNVSHLIISGCDKEGIISACEIIKNYPNIFATIGFHPSEANNIQDEDLKWLEQLIIDNKKIVGLGEIGLDYYYGKENKHQQIELFEKQLILAQKLNMPVVIHTRDAFQDTYDLLKKYHLTGIIHCFNGSIEVANLYIKLGYSLGIGGVITFKNSNLKDVISQIDLHNLVLETDSPYLSPEPYRGQVNSPSNIPIIANKVAETKKITIEEVEKITSDNAREIFDLDI